MALLNTPLKYFVSFIYIKIITQLAVFNCRLKVKYRHVLLKIVGNPVSNVQITFISSDLLNLHDWASSLLAHFSFLFWLVSISDEGSLPEVTPSDESGFASTLYEFIHSLNRSDQML